MLPPFLPPEDPSASQVLSAVLPGPDRKRLECCYTYRLTYLNLDATAAGCVLTCEVQGGRLTYQIAVERGANGQLRLHCTCADAVFRAEPEGRLCKHVQGFLQL